MPRRTPQDTKRTRWVPKGHVVGRVLDLVTSRPRAGLPLHLRHAGHARRLETRPHGWWHCCRQVDGNGRLRIVYHHCLLRPVHHPPSRPRDRPPMPAPRRTEAGPGRSLRAFSAILRWPTGERSVSVPSQRMRPRSKCLSPPSAKPLLFNAIPEIHQNCAVNRSGEYRPGETASGPPSAGASVQPHPHNPRKQRKNPAAAGSGERLRGGKWRTERDSNPR